MGIILSTTTLISVMAVIHGMDVVVATSASTMGTEGFRVLRFAFIGNWDPKKFLEYQRKNPELSLEEYDFLKNRVTLVKEMSPSSQRSVKLTYQGDLDDGVALISFNSTGRFFEQYRDRCRAVCSRTPKTIVTWKWWCWARI